MTNKDHKETILRRIANLLIIKRTDNPGLCSGRTGYALFFYHYFRHTGNPLFEREAGLALEDVIGDISEKLSPDFHNGLAGIAAGIGHLISIGMAETDDPDKIFANIDDHIFNDTKDPRADISNDTYPFFAKGHYVISRTRGAVMTTKKMRLASEALDDLDRVFSTPTVRGLQYFRYAASALLYLNYLTARNILRKRADDTYDVILKKLSTMANEGQTTAADHDTLGLVAAHPSSKGTRLRHFLRELPSPSGVARPASMNDEREHPLPDHWPKIVFSSFKHTEKELRQATELFKDPCGKAYQDTSYLLGLGLWLLKANISDTNGPL